MIGGLLDANAQSVAASRSAADGAGANAEQVGWEWKCEFCYQSNPAQASACSVCAHGRAALRSGSRPPDPDSAPRRAVLTVPRATHKPLKGS